MGMWCYPIAIKLIKMGYPKTIKMIRDPDSFIQVRKIRAIFKGLLSKQ
jgi:hypothetical protein